MTVTALDAYRHHNDRPQPVPTTPVGPDLAVGLSQSFADDALDALDLETLFEVDVILTHGDRGPLPARSVVELNAENVARADIAEWANYTDGLRPEWRELARA